MSTAPEHRGGEPSGRVAGRRFAARAAKRHELGSMAWLTLEVPGWPGARPGQFALLQVEPSASFLPRPLSVAAEDGEMVSFLIAPIGPGTRELCHLELGAPLWALGPLGNGFPLEAMVERPGGRRLLAVGGGVGAAPFALLLSHLAATSATSVPLEEVVVLLGFRDAAQAAGAAPVVDAVAAAGRAGLACRVRVSTEDGSAGERGLVTDLLRRELRPDDRVAVCGPPAMSEAVWSLCSHVARVDSWFSLEAGMACGVGSCHGCVIPLVDGSFARVCAEGPVFEGEQVWGRV